MSNTTTSRTASSVWFAATARELTRAARRSGLDVAVSFRSPPHQADATRTLRRREHGAVVAVRLTGRSCEEVAADMVDGVLAANRCDEAAIRGLLIECVTASL